MGRFSFQLKSFRFFTFLSVCAVEGSAPSILVVMHGKATFKKDVRHFFQSIVLVQDDQGGLSISSEAFRWVD